jgi:hypothetical protein
MRRVLVAMWGAEASAYVGRSLTLFRDPDVKFGGMETGGIRISHATHIDAPFRDRADRDPRQARTVHGSATQGRQTCAG